MSNATESCVLSSKRCGLRSSREFVREFIHHLPALDSGPLCDDVAASAGDQLAANSTNLRCSQFEIEVQVPFLKDGAFIAQSMAPLQVQDSAGIAGRFISTCAG